MNHAGTNPKSYKKSNKRIFEIVVNWLVRPEINKIVLKLIDTL